MTMNEVAINKKDLSFLPSSTMKKKWIEEKVDNLKGRENILKYSICRTAHIKMLVILTILKTFELY